MVLFRDWIQSIISILALPHCLLTEVLSLRHRITAAGLHLHALPTPGNLWFVPGPQLAPFHLPALSGLSRLFYLLLNVHSFFVVSLIPFFLHTFFSIFFLYAKRRVRSWHLMGGLSFFLKAFKQIYFNFFFLLSWRKEGFIYVSNVSIHLTFHHGYGSMAEKN